QSVQEADMAIRNYTRVVALVIAFGALTDGVFVMSGEAKSESIKRLVEALVSPNPMPKEFGPRGRVIYPPGYDMNAEAAVYQAASPLVEKGVVAFPVLMEYAEDKRFSFLMESPSGAMRTHTVGDACRLIVQHQLDAYETLGIYPRMVPSYFDKVVAGKKWDGWWHSH